MVVLILLFSFAAQNILEMRRESATSDELIKLTAGYTYFVKGDFRLNPLHPPFLKMLSGLPLLVLRPKIDFSDPSWNLQPNQWKFSFDFLYSNNADRLLFWGRMPVVLLTTLLGFFIFLWARQLYGNNSGVFALALFSFSPTFIAHSHLVTLDAGMAALLTIAFYFLGRHAHTGKRASLIYSAVFMGLALASKYLAFAMLPAFAILLWFIYQKDPFHSFPGNGAENRKETTSKQKSRKGEQEKPVQKSLVEEGSKNRWRIIRRFNLTLLSLMILLAVISLAALLSYLEVPGFRGILKGIALIRGYERPKFPFYLHGNFKEGGAWYFLLITFLIKTTPPLLLLILTRMIFLFKNWKAEWKDSLFLVLPSFAYFFVVSAFANPIGVRYLLPACSLLIIFSSGLIHFLSDRKYATWVLWVLLGWHAASSLVAFPHHLSYFNEFAGGPAHGTEWLDDSNVDWGQELKSLKKVMEERSIPVVTLISFSPYDNPEYYGIHCTRPPQEEWVAIFNNPQPGIYAVSAHWLARVTALGFDWKNRFPMIANLGNSMFVFEVK